MVMKVFKWIVKVTIGGLFIALLLAVSGYFYWSKPLQNYPVIDIQDTSAFTGVG